ncbi:MAG: sigma-54-dependent transcriptional regulator [Myxococcota bacterium]
MSESRLPEASILVVDDEPAHVTSLCKLFEREGARVWSATSGSQGIDILRSAPIQLALVDLMMPGMDGRSFLRAARLARPDVEVVVMTAYGTVENAVESMRDGAYDFVQKPFKSAVILRVVERTLDHQRLRAENTFLRRELAEAAPDAVKGRPIVGRSPAMSATLETVRQAAPSTATVLLTGESGTGKELMARALHEHSLRVGHPFVVVNCAALPESILESELFGYERGAFTGAAQRKEGRIERAHGGTLFLDEVGELSPGVQAKLLRVLQEGEFERLGGHEPVQIDFRLVAATNRDLQTMVRSGEFREDLYYRLAVITVELPPLRDRPEDVALLAEHFLERYAAKNQRSIRSMTPELRHALSRYRWPGNVRELENVIERAVVLNRTGTLTLDDLPGPLRTDDTSGPGIRREGAQIVIPVGTRLDEVERVLIRETLAETGGDKSLAAQLLGIAARTIYRKLEAERGERNGSVSTESKSETPKDDKG